MFPNQLSMVMRKIVYIVLVIAGFIVCFFGSMKFMLYYLRDTGSIKTVKAFEKALHDGDIISACSYISAEGKGQELLQFCYLLDLAKKNSRNPQAAQILYHLSYMEHVVKQLPCGQTLSVAEGDSVLGTDAANVSYLLSQPVNSDLLAEDNGNIGVSFFYFVTTSYLRIHQCAQRADCTVESVFTAELNQHKELCNLQLQPISQTIEVVKEQGEWKIVLKDYPVQMGVYMKRWSELIQQQITSLQMPSVSQE